MRPKLELDAADELPEFELPEGSDLVIDADVMITKMYGAPVDIGDVKRYLACGPEMFPSTTPLEMLKGLADSVQGGVEEMTSDLETQVDAYKRAVAALVAEREAAFAERIAELRDQLNPDTVDVRIAELTEKLTNARAEIATLTRERDGHHRTAKLARKRLAATKERKAPTKRKTKAKP